MDPTKCCSLFLVRLQYNIDEWFPRYCCSLGSRSVVEEAAVWGKWLEGGWGLRLRLLSDFFQSARLSGASSSTERVAKLNVIPDLSALDLRPVPEVGSKQLHGLLDDIRRRRRQLLVIHV